MPKVNKTGLTRLEQETYCHFNQEEDTCTLFTYLYSMQRHMEDKLGLKPDLTNDAGGKGYTFPKSWWRKPQLPPKRNKNSNFKKKKRGK